MNARSAALRPSMPARMAALGGASTVGRNGPGATSPAGTGLIYVGTSARLSYALGHAGFVPKGISKISARGVPWTSVILAFVVGLICFLPFPSWQGLVGLVTSATVIMYGFAPITLIALRRADPDRERPYKLPAGEAMARLAFIAANLIIYWTDSEAVGKLLLGVVVGFIIFGISYSVKRPVEKPPLDPIALPGRCPSSAASARSPSSGSTAESGSSRSGSTC